MDDGEDDSTDDADAAHDAGDHAAGAEEDDSADDVSDDAHACAPGDAASADDAVGAAGSRFTEDTLDDAAEHPQLGAQVKPRVLPGPGDVALEQPVAGLGDGEVEQDAEERERRPSP